jgi:hypothetical protein
LATDPLRPGESPAFSVLELLPTFDGVGLDLDAARNGASVWKMKEISRHKSTDVLVSYVREAELFQQHTSVGIY